MAALRTDGLRGALVAVLIALAALAGYTLLGRVNPSLVLLVNAFAVAPLLTGYLRGETAGAVVGTLCGLTQDAFSLGVFGVAGLSKTVLGFCVGWVSRKVNLPTGLRTVVFFFVMAAVELGLWAFFYAVISGEPAHLRNGFLFFQPLATAVLGGLGALARRRPVREAA